MMWQSEPDVVCGGWKMGSIPCFISKDRVVKKIEVRLIDSEEQCNGVDRRLASKDHES